MREVHLWRRELDVDAAVLASLEKSLSSPEQARAERFHAALDRARYTAARGWLRLLLAGYLDADPCELRFAEDAGGKPRLRKQGAQWLRFNLSHSAGLAVVAIANERELGVDVEQVREEIDVDAIARRLFSSREREVLATLPSEQRVRAFFAYWTMKEAYVKATGDGLRGVLPDFDAPLQPGEALRVLTMPAGVAGRCSWRVQAFDVGPDYRAAVAIEGDDALIPRVAREFRQDQAAPPLLRLIRTRRATHGE